MLPSLIKSPTPTSFLLTPSLSPSFLSFKTPIPTKTHHFLPLSLPKKFLPLSCSSSQSPLNGDEEEENVIGDCLVFEEGIFDDPFLHIDYDGRIPIRKKPRPVAAESLVPDEWMEAHAEINMTKKEKRTIAKQLEFGSRVEKKRNRTALPAVLLNMEERQSFKPSQLKPVVLDHPEYPLPEEVETSSGNNDGELGDASGGRVAPKNPRLGVADGSLEDVAEFFRSSDYEPGANGNKNSQGPRKLFTKEEKVLLNKRIPNLADATSRKWLPLHTLAASGEFYLVDKLLKHNVDINAADKDGLTAIHKAILGKKQAITNYLLRESANPFVRDKDGLTPLDLCLYSGRDVRTYELIKLLKELPKS
ncbi:ankyrin repeat domain-containing protein, chloroplastic isoform X2 [Magnolia sinica]|uniref:ankyrin repeat domain-containing protein, chloroplastic isoform X2 n=1 Tax=Magnolia sinica TaxID=86752 RepID=UPI002659D9EF|nr:ankyrin repeat domain-containing protein, chloroplastic isoform X2 [Magnolia sinica]